MESPGALQSPWVSRSFKRLCTHIHTHICIFCPFSIDMEGFVHTFFLQTWWPLYTCMYTSVFSYIYWGLHKAEGTDPAEEVGVYILKCFCWKLPEMTTFENETDFVNIPAPTGGLSGQITIFILVGNCMKCPDLHEKPFCQQLHHLGGAIH